MVYRIIIVVFFFFIPYTRVQDQFCTVRNIFRVRNTDFLSRVYDKGIFCFIRKLCDAQPFISVRDSEGAVSVKRNFFPVGGKQYLSRVFTLSRDYPYRRRAGFIGELKSASFYFQVFSFPVDCSTDLIEVRAVGYERPHGNV